MDSPSVVVVDVGSKHTVQMLLMEYDDMIESLSPDAADEPLRVRILPGRSRRDLHLFDTHIRNTCLKEHTVD